MIENKITSIIACIGIVLALSACKKAASSDTVETSVVKPLDVTRPLDTDVRKVRFGYDDRGRVISITGPGDRSKRLEYNDRDRQVLVDNGTEKRHYKFNRLGLLTGVNDTTGATAIKYDADGRIKSMRYPTGDELAYDYTDDGNIAAVAWGSNQYLKYERNLLGDIVRIETRVGRFLLDYNYDERFVHRRYPNGAFSNFSYNRAGQPVLIQHVSPAQSLILEFKYTYNDSGMLKKAEEWSSKGTVVIDYSYDAHGQLVSAKYSDGRSFTYEYDAFGNRVKVSSPSGSTTSTYGEYDQMETFDGRPVEHDAAGNVIGFENIKYRYDSEDQLIDDGLLSYRYNALGLRVQESSKRGITGFVHLIDELPYLLAETGKGEKQYVWNDGQVLAQIGESGPLFYLEDHLGSIRGAIDKAGNVVGLAEYTPYGIPIERIEGVRFGYAGEEQDENGRVYLRARYYEPKTARFLSKDPVLPQLMDSTRQNRYAYAANSPSCCVDSAGMQADCDYSNFYKASKVLEGFKSTKSPFASYSYIDYGTPPNEMDLWEGVMSEGEASVVQVPFLGEVDMNWRATYRINGSMYNISDDPMKSALWGAYGWARVALGSVFAIGYTELKHLGVADMMKGNFSGLPFNGQKSTWDSSRERYKNDAANFKGALLGTLEAMGFDMVSALEKVKGNKKKLSKSGRRGGDDDDDVMLFDTAKGFFGGPSDGPPSPPPGRPPFPPNGGGAAMMATPNVGGVYLNRVAEIIGDLSGLEGVTFDPVTNRILLVGGSAEGAALPPMSLDDLAVAYRTVFSNYNTEPGVSINPDSDNPHADTMDVVFFGDVGSTRLGYKLFEADRVMKSLSLGEDNISHELVKVDVEGYYNMLDLGFSNLGGKYNEGLWSQFRLIPERVVVKVSKDKKSITFPDTRIEVKTQTMRLKNNKLVPADGEVNEKAEYFRAHFTNHYDEYAREYPVFEELRQIANTIGLMKWLKDSGLSVDLEWLRNYEEPFDTPKTTPSLTVSDTRRVSESAKKNISIFGGTDMTVKNTYIESDNSESRDRVKALGAVASIPGVAEASFTDRDNRPMKVVAIPTSQTRAPGSKGLREGELGLVGRLYNSFHNTAGPFGYSWVFDLPRLRITQIREKDGSTPHVIVDGRKTVVKEFNLTRPFGSQDIFFKAYEVDMERGLLAFMPEILSGVRALYPDEEKQQYRVEYRGGGAEVFDLFGRILRFEAASGEHMDYLYDTSDRLSTIELVQRNRPALKVELSYDSRGRVVSAETPKGTVSYIYDMKGNLINVVSGDGEAEYAYEDRHLVTEVRRNGNVALSIKYDRYGRIMNEFTTNGDFISIDIETIGGETVVKEGTGDHMVVRKYDAGGRFLESKKPSGAILRSTYNKDGSLMSIEQTNEFGDRSMVEYSPDKRHVRYTNPVGNMRALLFDEYGRLKQIQGESHALLIKEYGQTNLGWLESTETSGRKVQVIFDKEKRPVERIVTAKNLKGGQLITRNDYGSDGLLKNQSIRGLITKESRYKEGRLEKETLGEDSISYSYDGAGRLNAVKSGNGKLRFSFNTEGLPERVDLTRRNFNDAYKFKNSQLVEHKTTYGLSHLFHYGTTGMLQEVDRNGDESWFIERAGDKVTYIRNGVVQLEFAVSSEGRLVEVLY